MFKYLTIYLNNHKSQSGFEDTPDLYLKTIATINEEVTDDNVTIYFIASEMSMGGKDWKPCVVIWDGEQHRDE